MTVKMNFCLFILIYLLQSCIAQSTETSTEESITDTTELSSTPEISTEESTTSSLTTSTVTTEQSSVMPSTEPTQGENRSIEIFFVSDVQYNIFPINNNMELCAATSGALGEECFGGFGQLLSVWNSTKNETSVLLNVGNMLDGKWFKVLKFDSAVTAMQEVGFSAVAPEPQMFKYGLDAAEKIYMANMSEMLVSFNYDTGTPTKEFELDSCKIAILGFIDKEQTDAMNVSGLNVQDEKEFIQEEIKALTGNYITVVIGSTTYSKALEIANIPGINLVLFSGNNAPDGDTNDYHCEQIVNSNNEVTYIVSLKTDSKNISSIFKMGKISVTMTDFCEVIMMKCENVLPYGELVGEPQSDLDQILVTTLEELQETVASTTIEITSSNNICQKGECLLGNLITDSILTAISMNEVEDTWSAVVKFAIFTMWTAVQNASLTGEVKLEDIYALFEDDSYIYSVVLNAVQLKKILEVAVADYSSPEQTLENYVQVSSYLHVTYDLQQSSGQRVKQIQAFGIADDTTQFHTMDLENSVDIYTVALPKFILDKEVFSFIRDESSNTSLHKITFLNALKDYISWKGAALGTSIPVLPSVGQRFTYSVETNSPGTTCFNNTGEVIILTLVVVFVLAGAGFVGWKYLQQRYRGRRDSTIHLMM